MIVIGSLIGRWGYLHPLVELGLNVVVSAIGSVLHADTERAQGARTFRKDLKDEACMQSSGPCWKDEDLRSGDTRIAKSAPGIPTVGQSMQCLQDTQEAPVPMS